MATYKSQAKFSEHETKQFRSFIQKIHPDRNPEHVDICTWATAKANAARNANQWYPVEQMIDALGKGMEAFVEYIKGLMAEKPKEEPKKKGIHINPETLAKAKAFKEQNTWMGRGGMNDWLKATFSMSAAEAKAYCDLLFVKSASTGGGKQGPAATFYAALKAGPMDVKGFEAWLATWSNSPNVQAHRSHYDAIREMANAIWAAKK